MRSLRILVVEDDAMIGMYLAEVLEGLGHEVCATEMTEAGAIAAARRYRPDLLIVDAWLGSGSGVSAVARICRDRMVPHLFVSGDPASVRAAVPQATVIQKPFREADLVRAIEQLMDPPSPSAS